MASDDQQMEMDMIAAMYGDTFEIIGEVPPQYKVQIATSPDEAPELTVVITYPQDYPEAAGPSISVENCGTKRRVLTDPLNADIARIIEENAGTLCAAVLIQRCQEFLLELDSVEEATSAAGAGGAGGERREDTVDPSIRMGTTVTPEVFAEWVAKHRERKAVRRAAEAKADEAKYKSASKLSGRQLWDSTIRNADWALFGSEGDAMDLDDAGYEFEAHEDDYDLEPEDD